MKKPMRGAPLKERLDLTRPKIEKLVSQLDWPYHNADHAKFRLRSAEQIISNVAKHERSKDHQVLLIKDCALMLDLGRLQSDRQTSLEETAVKMAHEIYGEVLTNTQYIFLDRILLTYSWRWEDFENTPGTTVLYHRGATMSNYMQKILGIADIFYFTLGWDEFLKAALRLIEECPRKEAFEVESFLEIQRNFVLEFIVRPLELMRHHFKLGYIQTLLNAGDEILVQLGRFSRDGSQKNRLQNRLDEIKSRVFVETEDPVFS